MQYGSGTTVECNDTLVVNDGTLRFAGHVRGINPVEGLIEVIDDDPAVYPWHSEWVSPSVAFPAWEN